MRTAAPKAKAEDSPVFLVELALGNENVAGQARFRGQQVVTTAIEPVFAGVVADGEQLSRSVVQELVVHVGEFLALIGQVFELADAREGTLGRFGHRAAQLPKPSFGLEQIVMCLAGRCGHAGLEGVEQRGQFLR